MLTSVASAMHMCRQQREAEKELAQLLGDAHAASQCMQRPAEIDEEVLGRRMEGILRKRFEGGTPPPARFVRRERHTTPCAAARARLVVTCSTAEGQADSLPPVRTVRWDRKRKLERPATPCASPETAVEPESVAEREGGC